MINLLAAALCFAAGSLNSPGIFGDWLSAGCFGVGVLNFGLFLRQLLKKRTDG